MPGLLELATHLKRTVCDFRDKSIEHHRNPRRIVGLSWATDGSLSLNYVQFQPPSPGNSALAPSSPVGQVAGDLQRYLAGVFDMIERNRHRGMYRLRDSTQP